MQNQEAIPRDTPQFNQSLQAFIIKVRKWEGEITTTFIINANLEMVESRHQDFRITPCKVNIGPRSLLIHFKLDTSFQANILPEKV